MGCTAESAPAAAAAAAVCCDTHPSPAQTTMTTQKAAETSTNEWQARTSTSDDIPQHRPASDLPPTTETQIDTTVAAAATYQTVGLGRRRRGWAVFLRASRLIRRRCVPSRKTSCRS